jgi:DNA (cytosine-5)-methyltransferase 1
VGGVMRVLDLFSGIGGFSLGLERTGGFQTVAFCEIEPYCQRVLAGHWPGVPIYDDIRELTAERLAADGIGVDVICGGFPCQDISRAGKGAGIEGERSGLWSEYARLIGELRPRYVIVENVAALLGRGLGRVLGDMAEIGFDAEWHCIPASAVGAPHRRDRLWLVAYPRRISGAAWREARDVACAPRTGEADGQEWERHGNAPHDSGADVADAAILLGDGSDDNGRRDCEGAYTVSKFGNRRGSADVADTIGPRLEIRFSGANGQDPGLSAQRHRESDEWWIVEPDVGRVAHGVPARVDRLRALGNAVVPQIPELIGRAILELTRA